MRGAWLIASILVIGCDGGGTDGDSADAADAMDGHDIGASDGGGGGDGGGDGGGGGGGAPAWRAVDAMGAATCGLATDGRVWCWGDNEYGALGDGTFEDRPSPGPVPGIVGATDIGLAFGGGCAVVGGALECWQSDQPPARVGADTDWTAVFGAGYLQICAQKADGGLWCGGLERGELSPVAGGEPWRHFSAARHRCGVKPDGTMWCWGEGDRGQLGEEAGSASGVPVQVGAGVDWLAVSAGDNVTCGLRGDGALWCWGGLLSGGILASPSPREELPGTLWRAVAAGRTAVCAIRDDGTLWCWQRTPEPEPRQLGERDDWVALDGGGGQTCGLTADGALWCWGNNEQGQVGIGITGERSLTPRRALGEGWVDVGTGQNHTCAVDVDRALFCWGLSPGRLRPNHAPERVDAVSDVVEIDAGAQWPCVRTGDGAVICSELEAWRRKVGAGATAIAVGHDFACALDAAGAVRCWGENRFGQLGDGRLGGEADTPVALAEQRPFSAVGAWGWTGAALVDGAVWSWGLLGPVGIEEHAAPTPEPLPDGGGFDALAGGESGGCGLRGGEVWCWEPRAAPVRVDVGGGWTRIVTARRLGCGLRGDGELACWGVGPLGDGEDSGGFRGPVTVMPGTRWQDLDATINGRVCAIQVDGSLWCWGSNEYGTFGDDSLDIADPMPVIRPA